jgi:hypothetical protein
MVKEETFELATTEHFSRLPVLPTEKEGWVVVKYHKFLNTCWTKWLILMKYGVKVMLREVKR